MAEREPGRPAVRFKDLFNQSIEIALIGAEIANMTFAGIAREAAGVALPAPIQDRDIEIPAQQFADNSKYFSMNSARPGKIAIVPAHSAPQLQRAARRVHLSRAVMAETMAPEAPDSPNRT